MKKYLLLFFIVTFFISLYSQNNPVKVKIEVSAKSLSKTDTVFISGNNPMFGNWMPNLIPLKKINDSLWIYEGSFPAGSRLEFKFTRGLWANEALAPDSTVPGNHQLYTAGDTTVSYTINLWRDMVKPVVRGQITGTVDYYKNIKYKSLLSRDIIVWLPPSYVEDKEKHYAVLYMHDGQNIIDPSTSTLGIDWQIDETADSLIRKGEVEPFIVVGINNTAHRRSEYSNNDTGAVYMDFLVNKIKPMIDSIYRTKPQREFTAVCGSSMGGLISFMLLWEYNDIFSKAICMSPAFKLFQYDYVTPVTYDYKKRSIRLYIDNGGIGLEAFLQPGIDAMLSALKNKGYKEKDDFVFILDKNAQHNEAAWAKRLPEALKYIFGKK